MHLVSRVTLIYVVPSIFGLLAAALLLFAYLKLGVVVQLEPVWLEAVRLILLFSASIFSVVLLKNLTLAKTYKIIIALFLFLWSLFHAIKVEQQVLSYLGAGCCEEEKASLLNVIDSVINPFFPFVSIER